MKLPNEKAKVSYGVANGASFWMMLEGGRLRKARQFWRFANERQAAAAARKLVGGYVVRRVEVVYYEVDK